MRKLTFLHSFIFENLFIYKNACDNLFVDICYFWWLILESSKFSLKSYLSISCTLIINKLIFKYFKGLENALVLDIKLRKTYMHFKRKIQGLSIIWTINFSSLLRTLFCYKISYSLISTKKAFSGRSLTKPLTLKIIKFINQIYLLCE